MNSRFVRLGLACTAATAAIVATASAAYAADEGITPYAGPPCEVGNVCVFDGPSYTGARHDYFACGVYDVRGDGLGRVGSFMNNQAGDQVATFSGPAADGAVVPQYSSTAVDARPDTTDRTTWVVQPC